MLIHRYFLLTAVMVWLLTGCATTEQKPGQVSGAEAVEGNVSSVERDLEEGRVDLAILELEPLLKKNPDSPHLNALAGQAYARSGDLTKAKTHYEHALGLTPDDPQLQLNYGVFLCKQKQYVEADNNFLRAIRNPENPYRDIALVNAGICARKAGDLQRAERYFNAALQVNPKSAVALYQLARLSMQVDMPAQARIFMMRYDAIAEPTPKSLLLSTVIGDELGDYNFASLASDQLMENYAGTPEAGSLVAGSGREYLGLQAKTRPEDVASPVLNEEVLSSMLVSDVQKPVTPAAVDKDVPQASVSVMTDNDSAAEMPGVIWIEAQPRENYTLQLSASANIDSLMALSQRLKLEDYGIFRFNRDGREMFALLSGSYADHQQAMEAGAALAAQGHRDQPWVRQFQSIHRLMQSSQP